MCFNASTTAVPFAFVSKCERCGFLWVPEKYPRRHWSQVGLPTCSTRLDATSWSIRASRSASCLLFPSWLWRKYLADTRWHGKTCKGQLKEGKTPNERSFRVIRWNGLFNSRCKFDNRSTMCTSFWPDASIGSLTCYVLRAINSFHILQRAVSTAASWLFGVVNSSNAPKSVGRQSTYISNYIWKIIGIIGW